uniref:Ig-like domain-containing protein n=1 Tax=Maylandia zebra TaxID=106582 RepID=A0A3P9DHN9_9CICH
LRGTLTCCVQLDLGFPGDIQQSALTVDLFLVLDDRFFKLQEYLFSSSVSYFFWYKQKSSLSPQFLINEYSEKNEKLKFRKDQDKSEFHLEISSAAVTDSAVYYCALQPTVTGNSKTLYKNLWSKVTFEMLRPLEISRSRVCPLLCVASVTC